MKFIHLQNCSIKNIKKNFKLSNGIIHIETYFSYIRLNTNYKKKYIRNLIFYK